MSPQTSFLISCQCYFSHTPAVTERSNQRDADFRSKAGQRHVFPRPNPTSFLQFITPQLCWYNSLLLTLFSDGSFQESRLGLSPTVLVAQVRRVGRGVGRGCAAGEQGLVRLGLLLCQGAVQWPRSHCGQPDVLLAAGGGVCVCFPKKLGAQWVPEVFMAQRSLGQCANPNVHLTVCRSWSQCWEI